MAAFEYVEVYTNLFPITQIPTRLFYQYQDIEPEVLSSRRNYIIINRVQNENAELFNPRALYDGRKLLYTMRDLSAVKEFELYGRRDRSRLSHRVRITRVAIIDAGLLRNLTRRLEPNERADPNAMPLTLAQLIIRQAPNYRHGFPAHARAFFDKNLSKNLGMGVQAWPGFFQSVRPATDQLLINVDATWSLFYNPCWLIESMLDALDKQNTRDLERLDRPTINKLRGHLKGVRVVLTVGSAERGRPTENIDRSKPILDIVDAAGLQEFDKDGERLTVAEHFQRKYNVQVRYPRIAGVRIGRTAIVPAEFCKIVPGQFYRKKLTPRMQKDFLNLASQKPHVRRTQIQQAVNNNVFSYADSEYIKESGMEVSPNMLTITGKILSPPDVHYGGNAVVTSGELKGQHSTWNVVRKKFIQPCKPIYGWAVAIFDHKVANGDRRDVMAFVNTLMRNLRALGIAVHQAPEIVAGNVASSDHVQHTLVDAGQRAARHTPNNRPQLILVILPEYAAECKLTVKRWGDIYRNVPTQCVRGGKWNAPRGQDQYCNNLALKINSRLGGVNSVTRSPASPLLANSMVVGADVGHPGPGLAQKPSFAGLVASVDQNISVYTSYCRVQEPRLEIIHDLEDMMLSCCKDYDGFRQGVPPAYVIFYRDGVSEGEFDTVADIEIRNIKSAFDRMGGKWQDPECRPKLLFITVGKRHHVRFFPKRSQDEDRSGNCRPGLLVENDITNPRYDDFYLQSHPGLLGTSKSAHYVVLQNETGESMEMIQTITNHLCHSYAAATRAVSIPAPVFYADQVCSRLDIHCSLGSASDAVSSLGSGEVEFDLEKWKKSYQPSGLSKRFSFLSSS